MFYDLDSSRVTLQEYRWGTPLLLMPLAALLRLLRVRLPGSADDPNVESLEPFRVSREMLPAEIQSRFRPLEAELQGNGFVDPVYFAIDDPGSATRIYQAVYRHSSGTILARLHYRQWTQPSKVREFLFPEFLSGFADGSYLISSAGKADLLAPPCVTVNRQEKASLGDLWRSHLQQYSLVAFGKVPLAVYSAEQTLAWIEQQHAVVRDFHLERGVFRPRDEVVLEPIEGPADPAAPAYDATTTAVLTEIRRIEQRKSSWASAILILIVTVGAFVAMGRKEIDWTWMGLIVGVLFVHELGHLGAMWLFGYRNLRMFFIPFLGAAASGKNYNAAGWKKAMVSLMGPLPGILLGGALGITALVLGWKEALQAAFLLVFLNGLNLLPIVPLDGGWIMHVVLFCRHPILDVIFRVVAALLLFVLSLALGKFLMFLGIAMLMSVPAAYRTARVVERLRERGMNTASPDARTIPTPMAAAIIGELRDAGANKGGAKATAQMALQVFESLNARPPGVLGSLAFLTVHGGTFLLAVVLAGVFIFGVHGGFEQIAKELDRQRPQAARLYPRHPVQSGSVLTWKGAEAVGERVNTLVADFASRQPAEAAYRQLMAELPPQASATLFGETVFVVLPAEDDAARERWLSELKRMEPKAFANSERQTLPMRLTCQTPSLAVAKAITEEVETYLGLPWTIYPVPPWSKEQRVTAEQEKARRTYLATLGAGRDLAQSARLSEIQKRYEAAEQLGDRQAMQNAADEIGEAMKEEHQAGVRRMREEARPQWDLEVLDLCIERFENPAFRIEGEQLIADEDGRLREVDGRQGGQQSLVAEWEMRLGQRVGQLAMDGHQPMAGADCWSTRAGVVTRTGAFLEFDWICFPHTPDGATALVEWLAQKGCVDMKYEFVDGED